MMEMNTGGIRKAAGVLIALCLLVSCAPTGQSQQPDSQSAETPSQPRATPQISDGPVQIGFDFVQEVDLKELDALGAAEGRETGPAVIFQAVGNDYRLEIAQDETALDQEGAVRISSYIKAPTESTMVTCEAPALFQVEEIPVEWSEELAEAVLAQLDIQAQLAMPQVLPRSMAVPAGRETALLFAPVMRTVEGALVRLDKNGAEIERTSFVIRQAERSLMGVQGVYYFQ